MAGANEDTINPPSSKTEVDESSVRGRKILHRKRDFLERKKVTEQLSFVEQKFHLESWNM